MKHAMKVSFVAFNMIAALVALATSVSMAAETSSIVDTRYMVEAMERNAIIWDTRSAAAYKQGHIPGAVNIDDIGQVLRDENTEDYIALVDIEKLLGAAGIDPAKEIVVYGEKGNPYVYFGLVTLQYLNAANAKVYHGGIDDWKSSGRMAVTEPARLAPIALKLKTRPELLVDTREVVRRLHDPNVQIVDARTSKEYRGEEIRAIRGGHIPGAIPIHYMENWVDPETPGKLEKKLVANKDGMNLKSPDQLRTLYSKLNPDKETIVYCQSGIRASETATVLKELGFKNVRVYDSSWLGYGNTLDAPAESVTFFNVGAMQGRMNAMQKRIDSLEKELVQARTAK
jgi:thiosulfate/3-mercaptopyruvate sulfurtransferase